MLTFINAFNIMVFVIFTACYSYQLFYVFYVLWYERKEKQQVPKEENTPLHRYAFISSARNERNVIADLIKSIQAQNYPADLIDIYIIADNCTDDTAEIARKAGAHVYERFNQQLIGKGYALDEFFKYMFKKYPEKKYDGYFVFDSDNLLDVNYTQEMNKVFAQGYRVITSYRNSKNYASNWISAGYALWFIRESKYLSKARMLLKTSCAISGSGFLVSEDLLRERGGWNYHLLTEDIEFSISNILEGEIIGYADKAIIYDEQPITFSQSWHQRLRWSKGFLQVLGSYGLRLCKGIFDKEKRRFSCFDMLMTIAPAVFLMLLSVILNGCILLNESTQIYVNQQIISVTQHALFMSVFNFYFMLFAVGTITTITEWQNIDAKAWQKIIYTFTFPIFILTYIPITICAVFKKVKWTPIAHGLVEKTAA